MILCCFSQMCYQKPGLVLTEHEEKPECGAEDSVLQLLSAFCLKPWGCFPHPCCFCVHCYCTPIFLLVIFNMAKGFSVAVPVSRQGALSWEMLAPWSMRWHRNERADQRGKVGPASSWEEASPVSSPCSAACWPGPHRGVKDKSQHDS